MTHPEELLAEYVDGTLPEGERAVVSAHLETCARCRAEVGAATSARTALREVPAPAMPEGLAAAALEAAARDAAERAPNVTSIESARTARLYRWMAGAGVAAAIVLLGAVALPGLGGGSDDREEPAAIAADSGSQEGAGSGRLESIPGEITDEDVRRAASDLLVNSEQAQAPVPAPGTVEDGAAHFSTTSKAEQCLIQAFPHLDNETRPRLLWRADYEGQDAYLGFYADSPGAGLPPEYVRVWIASVKECAVIASTQVTP